MDVLRARLDATRVPEERIGLLTAIADMADERAKTAAARQEIAGLTQMEVLRVKLEALDARVALERARQGN